MTPTKSAGQMSSWLFALGAVWLLGLATFCLTWRLGARKLDRLFQDAYELPQEIDDLARAADLVVNGRWFDGRRRFSLNRMLPA